MLVPKNPDGFCLSTTMSLGPGAIGVTISLPSRLVTMVSRSSLPPRLVTMVSRSSLPREFFHNHEPESQLSSRRTPVVYMTGTPLPWHLSISERMYGSAVQASSPHELRQRLIDSRIGSGRSPQNAQLTSITSSAGRLPKPPRAP